MHGWQSPYLKPRWILGQPRWEIIKVITIKMKHLDIPMFLISQDYLINLPLKALIAAIYLFFFFFWILAVCRCQVTTLGKISSLKMTNIYAAGIIMSILQVKKFSLYPQYGITWPGPQNRTQICQIWTTALHHYSTLSFTAVVPNLYSTKFCGRQFFPWTEVRAWFQDDSSALHSSSPPAMLPGS